MFKLDEKKQIYTLIKTYEELSGNTYLAEDLILSAIPILEWSFFKFVEFLKEEEFITNKEYTDVLIDFNNEKDKVDYLEDFIIGINEKAKENFDYWYIEYLSSLNLNFDSFFYNLNEVMKLHSNSTDSKFEETYLKKLEEISEEYIEKNQTKKILIKNIEKINEFLDILDTIVSSSLELELINNIRNLL